MLIKRKVEQAQKDKDHGVSEGEVSACCNLVTLLAGKPCPRAFL